MVTMEKVKDRISISSRDERIQYDVACDVSEDEERVLEIRINKRDCMKGIKTAQKISYFVFWCWVVYQLLSAGYYTQSAVITVLLVLFAIVCVLYD